MEWFLNQILPYEKVKRMSKGLQHQSQQKVCRLQQRGEYFLRGLRGQILNSYSGLYGYYLRLDRKQVYHVVPGILRPRRIR